MTQGLEHISYKENKRAIGSSPWKTEGSGGDSFVAFQYLKGAYKKDWERLLNRACGDRTRGSSFERKGCEFRLDVE